MLMIVFEISIDQLLQMSKHIDVNNSIAIWYILPNLTLSRLDLKRTYYRNITMFLI